MTKMPMNLRVALLVILTLSIFYVSAASNVQTVKATWIEADITQDTEWKTRDSPFVAIKGITILSNATLTIEAGSEVRFGDGFYLYIYGGLNALGNETHPIFFTSNRLNPMPNAWSSITFASSSRPIVLRHVIIKYASYGIYMSRNLAQAVLSDSEVAFCERGVMIGEPWFQGTYGNLLVERNRIHQNQHGIYFSDYAESVDAIREASLQNITIRKNDIFLNKETGITVFLFGGPYSQNISISENMISQNEQCGINIKSGIGASICGNRISKNGGGPLPGTSYLNMYPQETISRLNLQTGLPSSPLWAGIVAHIRSYYNSTSGNYESMINNNSIAYSSYGVFFWDYRYYSSYYGRWYTEGSHTAMHNNDIYGCQYGVNVTRQYQKQNVNAEYNYWGAPSGAYHESLNPTGTGNPANGDGTDLDFIPFLASPSGSINQQPNAILRVDSAQPYVNETVTFDGANSTDDGRIDYYLFSFGDGANSGWTPLSMVTHKYAAKGTYNATLTVMDDFGLTSNDTQQTVVQVIVIPEFSPILILPVFIVVTLLGFIIYGRKRNKHPKLELARSGQKPAHPMNQG
jgi:hypothetical protein